MRLGSGLEEPGQDLVNFSRNPSGMYDISNPAPVDMDSLATRSPVYLSKSDLVPPSSLFTPSVNYRLAHLEHTSDYISQDGNSSFVVRHCTQSDASISLIPFLTSLLMQLAIVSYGRPSILVDSLRASAHISRIWLHIYSWCRPWICAGKFRACRQMLDGNARIQQISVLGFIQLAGVTVRSTYSIPATLRPLCALRALG